MFLKELEEYKTKINLSDWSNFSFDDNNDDTQQPIDMNNIEYALENDIQEQKALIGNQTQPPKMLDDSTNVKPIFVPQGLQLELEYIRYIISMSHRDQVDGPIFILQLNGRFWHQRSTVLARVGAYIMGRIPEIIDDENSLSDE